MNIYAIVWPEEQVEHIARHNVTPEEFEEVCFGQSLVLRTKAMAQALSIKYLGRQRLVIMSFVS